MASQSSSSFGSISTPEESPSTAQLLGTELLPKADVPRSYSPITSIEVAPSITPPPSSQIPPHGRASASAAAMSSPPTTDARGQRREDTDKPAPARPTLEQIDNASPEALREMVRRVVAENMKLEGEGSEARMTAAHWKFQYTLLAIESEEALKRMEVEHDIIRREVQVLQFHGREMPKVDYTEKMRAYCKTIQEDNAVTRRRLERAKQVIEMKDGELMDAKDEIFRLQTRIRQNREHINTLRSPGGPLHFSTPKTTPATPHKYRGTPKHTPNTSRSNYGYSEHQDARSGFSALIEAGNRVLNLQSQENTSAPSTPTVPRRPNPYTPNRHHRGVQSLSSFPATPGSARPMTGTSTLLPSAQFSSHADNRLLNTLSHHASQQQQTSTRQRRRDSTISASDSDEVSRAAYRDRDHTEEVQESQASQSATEMLRTSHRESSKVAHSRTSTTLPANNYAQSKIYGPVTKRKLKTDHELLSAKKIRKDELGLGVGFDASL
ncbi:uncharacterized protein L3040_003476 [Drepanopeziza brunnea f. sp. 'multigermtubi']|uniref:FAD-dependent oxidoreductase-like enzyme n=1 Tax=Marssonina brunnea f. sp. multigermtubi (strain MB_m1) TaxID=1072389 RepID=K1X5V8_MARBU|nr:FAD-dependent oxidoreductase-like enzyme [Drepanopeziza brunnea f. sp. 'multigermtubi' MB_m1]EKD16038.1 FAD-dependent oxidoreductase-like enzyme [Drepanopeziza brunnea f. sp. 'multigermtubi' MB_m1]KAJ5047656.1 hypothetical protein L3040_003476 [Drepanopeziza brunnea f. sp. 'multigermtubi']